MSEQHFGGVERMIQNENFNMIVKKFILNEGLVGFIVINYAVGAFCGFSGLMGYKCGTMATPQMAYTGLFMLFLGVICNCLWYCLREYDKKYGLFNGWDNGCEVCKSLCQANVQSFSAWKEYKLNLEGYASTRWIVKAKGHPLYCPNCGRKLSSFNHPRYW